MPQNQGYLSNTLTGMLVDEYGSVDWLTLPVFDSHPVFANILNKEVGGQLSFNIMVNGVKISFNKFEVVEREYIFNAPILRSTLFGYGYCFDVIDFMPANVNCFIKTIKFHSQPPKQLSVDLSFFMDAPFKLEIENKTVKIILNHFKLYYKFDKPVYVKDNSIIIDLQDDLSLTCHLSFLKNCLQTHSLTSTLEWWKYYFKSKVDIEVGSDEIRDAYRRSLQVLHNLIYSPTGAILAAPTTSIPAILGSDSNWDYRYCWIRDSSLSCEALSMAGCFDDAKRILKFMFKVQAENGCWEYPLYTINGKKPPKEFILPVKDDYGGPIRIGNDAAEQYQIDSEGSVLNAVFKYYQHSGDIIYLLRIYSKLEKAANIILENWNRKENGIWEFRNGLFNYTYGKAVCASGLDVFLRISKILDKKIDESMYENVIKKIVSEINAKGFSNIKKSYIQSFEKNLLDASVLALPLLEVISINDPRMKTTLNRIIDILDRDGGIARFAKEPHPFYLTTFWLMRCLILLGDFQHFIDLLSSCLYCSNKLHLMGEQFNPKTLEQRGNFPQSFSHLEYIKTIIEAFLKLNKDFKILVPVNIFKTGRIFNFKVLGKNISLTSHLDKHNTRVYINGPVNSIYLIPKTGVSAIKLKGGVVTGENDFYEVMSQRKNLEILC